MSEFTQSQKNVTELLSQLKLVSDGKTMEKAGLSAEWVTIYGSIARRCKDDREFGISCYPYEQGPQVGPFQGGYFEHRHWSVRKDMEQHPSLRAITEYETNYINASGYWLSMHEAALSLRQESLVAKKYDHAAKIDVWCSIFVRYALRVLGMRTEFYKLSARDPTYARMVMPTLQNRSNVPAADDLTGPLDKLEAHLSTQMMKAVATLAASNATKRSRGGKKDGAAEDK